MVGAASPLGVVRVGLGGPPPPLGRPAGASCFARPVSPTQGGSCSASCLADRPPLSGRSARPCGACGGKGGCAPLNPPGLAPLARVGPLARPCGLAALARTALRLRSPQRPGAPRPGIAGLCAGGRELFGLWAKCGRSRLTLPAVF